MGQLQSVVPLLGKQRANSWFYCEDRGFFTHQSGTEQTWKSLVTRSVFCSWSVGCLAPPNWGIHPHKPKGCQQDTAEPATPYQLHKFCMGQEQNRVCLVLPSLCVMLPIKRLAKWHSWLSPFPSSLFSLTPSLSLFFEVLGAWTALTLHLSSQSLQSNLLALKFCELIMQKSSLGLRPYKDVFIALLLHKRPRRKNKNWAATQA